MKTTVFTKYHIAAGAKMAEFAGYNMPIEFTGINDEHMAVRNGAGVFDVSHMGEIWVKGPRALDLLQRITTNDVSKLFDGKVQYTCMPNGRGGIVDDILVYRVDAETYMLCVNAANIDKDWKHICAEGKAFGMEAGHGRELYNASDEICQLAVQGPLAMKIVQKMCDEPVEEMEYYTFKKMKVAGCDAILSITGYTGSGGCEIYAANEDGDKLWKALWEAGEEFGLKNIGLGARDTLRLEKGFCLYGNDIDDTTSPLEAGLGWITKFAEGKDFIDRAAMERLKAEGVEFQINTTVTRDNLYDFKKIFELCERIGAAAWHIFLLVPMGRAAELADQVITAQEYEDVLHWFYDFRKTTSMHLKATWAPHYYRIMRQRAREEGVSVTPATFGMDAMTRGCLGGTGFCFISHVGQVQPCGYLTLDCGNVRTTPFPEIWRKSKPFLQFRDQSEYKGKCGVCEFHKVCGGCRARAWSMDGDYMGEEPLCTYQPRKAKEAE